ncbi:MULTISPECIES: carbohydrate-binding module family 20 domain-containing protein [unclassified Pseudomonas]|jgi:alpha-amylase|uniref:carbohydrate-binding module family 20 domain-containing protein n=1 Tax=unclassified Pseudomonas TaxID=196821 RepID=UPI002A364982|nr:MULTISPECIES: carbohydrate-binding module family 20 domain-containing protein [unclassified Pseudomonas]MDX9669748.1 carbohydrate-binding module family 20 domain-containing protein [Pseudomonas sp. P8_250]WPN36224.1 carbohydrate-binding module family 20 domain-containing protein [Pseudomonas sp. P8_139]WPN41975.1 carbohydrate-binding module family 20 domain-containing protein [Pseudomonas sp. P8_229]
MNRISYLLPLSVLLMAILPANGYAGATWTYSLPVNFRCDNGVTTMGYSVYVVGNTKELGNDKAAEAFKLTPSAYPSWTGKVTFLNLKPDDVVTWKCIIRNETNPGDVKAEGPENNVTLSFKSTPQATASF